MRIDRYWKQAAAGLLAMMMFMTAGGGMDSFAMTDSQPFKAQGQALTAPDKIIIKDDQDQGQSAQSGQTAPVIQQIQSTNGQAGQSGGSQAAGQANGGQANGGQTAGQANGGQAAGQANAGQTAVSSQAAAASQPVIQAKAQVAQFGEVSTPKTDTSSLFGQGRLTMLANHDTNAQLLSVIIENGEGGLIVVDGGWTNNTEYLLNQIKQKGGHVKAWLITHPDSDHAGALADILYKHNGEITIDGIYYSFHEDSWYAEKDAEVANMVAYLKGAFALVPQDTLHGDIVSGQVIDAGPAKIQVLNKAYKATSDFVNNSSVAYMVSLNGTNVVFLGDLARAGGEMLMADHDLRALKCDVVQLAHHGQNGVDFEVYKALKPSVALWPTPQWLWDNDGGSGAGTGPWLTQETKNWMVRLGIKTSYCIKDGDQVIE
ncbi:MBL fold metallo-hydrolase [Lachnoclostridium pacaense]|uniref:ComEC/Rec2 family competence protein n=1 Tax=Enterocloster hominis (ex Hitch et al. 2024) TaxID=1917870 RepID=UPI001D11A495|nr:MBL fold metallo-hydrolase [Lachnoclostridium pacaense]MCC2877404.1 MBL fold metallo-hydrolase [Lachnoclostridium pacaense]